MSTRFKATGTVQAQMMTASGCGEEGYKSDYKPKKLKQPVESVGLNQFLITHAVDEDDSEAYLCGKQHNFFQTNEDFAGTDDPVSCNQCQRAQNRLKQFGKPTTKPNPGPGEVDLLAEADYEVVNRGHDFNVNSLTDA